VGEHLVTTLAMTPAAQHRMSEMLEFSRNHPGRGSLAIERSITTALLSMIRLGGSVDTDPVSDRMLLAVRDDGFVYGVVCHTVDGEWSVNS
jgi:hypothetical protein